MVDGKTSLFAMNNDTLIFFLSCKVMLLFVLLYFHSEMMQWTFEITQGFLFIYFGGVGEGGKDYDNKMDFTIKFDVAKLN